MPTEILHAFPTTEWAQCRNERPFRITIRVNRADSFYGTSFAKIDCPTCGRVYVLQEDLTWTSDRPLRFLKAEEVEKAKQTAI